MRRLAQMVQSLARNVRQERFSRKPPASAAKQQRESCGCHAVAWSFLFLTKRVTHDCHLVSQIVVQSEVMSLIDSMVIAGALGGSASTCLNYHPAYPGRSLDQWSGNATWSWAHLGDWAWKLGAGVILGIAAAFVVPVFLHAMSSDLIAQVADSEREITKQEVGAGSKERAPDVQSSSRTNAWYTLFGFCVLAAYAAQRFLQAMLERVLRELRQQKARLNNVEASAKSAEAKASVAAATAQSAKTMAEDLDADFDEPEQEPVFRTMAATSSQLTDDERRLLEAFQQAWKTKRWLRRSKTGLSIDTGLSDEAVDSGLRRLEGRGLIKRRQGAGRAGWLLTAEGMALQVVASAEQ
jgi:hypothetical protein